MSERYEVERITPEAETRWNFNDLDEAAIFFYRMVADDYREPSTEVALHDLVAAETLASFQYDESHDVGRVEYDITK